jgi:molybdopterin synthase catalytic subunit
MFAIVRDPIDVEVWSRKVVDPVAGAFTSFEGRVRNHADGRQVESLVYEAYDALAEKEGESILREAHAKFDIARAACVHRAGHLAIGDAAVWVGVSAAHRVDAFAACRFIIDEVKRRVPIWKKELYADGDKVWVESAPAERGQVQRS